MQYIFQVNVEILYTIIFSLCQFLVGKIIITYAYKIKKINPNESLTWKILHA